MDFLNDTFDLAIISWKSSLNIKAAEDLLKFLIKEQIYFTTRKNKHIIGINFLLWWSFWNVGIERQFAGQEITVLLDILLQIWLVLTLTQIKNLILKKNRAIFFWKGVKATNYQKVKNFNSEFSRNKLNS